MALQLNGGTQGPSWSTKIGGGIIARCNDGTGLWLFRHLAEDLAGGEFFVDRIEIRETP
jgi:hypothetical protein